MSISSQGKCSFRLIQHDSNMSKAASQSEAGDVITMNTLSDTPKPFTVTRKYKMTPPTTVDDSESGNETDLENEPQDEDRSRYTLFVRPEKGQYRTMCYQKGEINWVNPANNYWVRVSDQDSFQHLRLATDKALDAVLQLEEGLGINREVTVEVFLQLLRWSLNDRFKQRAEN
ncbi:hypothetical protein B0T10DRAFT_467147 [Thelonectria olida]|uniref:Uncharacterized protein n=1 Tax=Thelonectria olida TaxID=1576542 RepID=A0A9P8VQJ3_9HYPO|nr:hypothetical protein B0T10DRAFT_467147 [Thelonectria olida]